MASSKKTQTVSVSNVNIYYYPGTSNKTVYADWDCKGSATSFTVAWQIMPYGSNKWFAASTTTSSTPPKRPPYDCPTYDIPQNCQKVKALVKVSGVASGTYTVTVYEPIKIAGAIFKYGTMNALKTLSKKVKKEIPKWKASPNWVESAQQLNGYDTLSTTPSAPSITIDSATKKGVVKLENYNDTSGGGATKITFEIVRRCESTVATEVKQELKITSGLVSAEFNAINGYMYKARAKAIPEKKGFTHSEWSSYCSEVSAGLDKVSEKPGLSAEKKAGVLVVKVQWKKVKGAKKYRVEYTKDPAYFDHDTGQVSSVEVDAPVGQDVIFTYISGEIEMGHHWYFRVRAEGEDESVYGEWSPNNDIVLGTAPAAPTSWSLEEVGKVGGKVTLCWTHNSTDGSIMEWARVSYKIGASGSYTNKDLAIQSQETEEDKVIMTYSWENLPTGSIPDSGTLYWKVCTKGIYGTYPNGFGTYSTERSIKFYSPPTLTMSIENAAVTANTITTLTSDSAYVLINRFPITILTTSGPQSQTPIGINYEIVAEEDYVVSVEDGTERYYAQGEVVFRHYTNIGTGTAMHSQRLILEPGNVFLQNATHYTIRATIAMSNGLTATAQRGIYTHWANADYDLTADIIIDQLNLLAYVTPQCYNIETRDPINTGILVSIYRRDVNGTFVLVSKNNDISDHVTVMDLHPALDYARYRLVGIDKVTGLVSFVDLPGEPVGEQGAVIQWDEAWRTIDEGIPRFKETLDTIEDENYPAGSLLRLDYNIDINDDMGKETSLVSYAGRTYPVSYYGTQRSLTSKWTVQVQKNDMATINAIRRLAMFGGDSYVREPNGTGYWAALTVSYSISHDSSLIPVNFSITRVEGDDLGEYARATIPEVTVVLEPEESPTS